MDTDTVIRMVGQKFHTFGGGQKSDWNPIVNATTNKPYMFAAGVDVADVVEFIRKKTNNTDRCKNCKYYPPKEGR